MEKTHIKEKGITIITLVITIIILLILAGISKTSLVGNDGLINKAKTAKEKAEKASIIEQIQTDIMAKQAENMRTNLSQNELKEILNKYVEKEEDIKYDETDTSKIASIITKDGNYEILLSNIWDGKTIIDEPDSSNNDQDISSTEIGELRKEIDTLKSQIKTMNNDFNEKINKKQDNLDVQIPQIGTTEYIELLYKDPIKKYGNVVTLNITCLVNKDIPVNQPFLSVPEGFRPTDVVKCPVVEANGYVTQELTVMPEGTIMLGHQPWGKNTYMAFSVSYICE